MWRKLANKWKKERAKYLQSIIVHNALRILFELELHTGKTQSDIGNCTNENSHAIILKRKIFVLKVLKYIFLCDQVTI